MTQEKASSQKHVAFFAEPWSGVVNPTLAVVSALVRRGYRVTYVTSDKFAGIVSDAGAEAVLYSIPFTASAPQRMARSMTWEEIARAFHFMIDLARQILCEVRPRYDTDRPDLILYINTCFAGRVLAQQWGVPAIQAAPTFAFHDAFFSRRNGVCYTPAGFVDFNSKLDAFLQENGVDSENGLFHKEKLNIYFLPRAFQFEAETFDSRFFFAGGCITERRSLGKWENKLSIDNPLILVSASTGRPYEPEYFAMLIDALRDLPWSVVISTGDTIDLSDIRDIPEGMEVHRYLPYASVLPHCWLNICHGGTSTIVESMHHGVAMICVSLTDEQAENSNRVAELGLGVHLRGHEVTPEIIRNTVLRLADDRAMQSRVKQMQHTVQHEPGRADDVVNQIEHHWR
jgi:demethyllactenocin mycarosyltransferase